MIRSLVTMFGPRYGLVIAAILEDADYKVGRFLRKFWTTQDFSKVLKDAKSRDTPRAQQAALTLMTGMLLQVIVGLILIFLWWGNSLTAGNYFGLALVLSYPIVWPHLAVVALALSRTGHYITNPKKLGRAIVCMKLEYQVRALRKRHDFKIVAVVGSVGKTSTKLAIADLLSKHYRVRHQSGNYNDRVTVPLIFFGHSEPNIFNIFAWFKIFRANARAIRSPYPYDIVVVELGTDGPGFMKEFAYLQPELAVVTAVSPEHMEYFKTLDAVAAEELTVFDFTQQVLVNGDDIQGKYLIGRDFTEYSTTSPQADYYAKAKPKDLSGQALDITFAKKVTVKGVDVQYIGVQGAKFALAAAAVADMMGMSHKAIASGLEHLSHFAGRMQVLAGIHGSQLIDDTYNSSPLAAIAALDVLYASKGQQKIAIMGGMNELGDYSPEAHREVGAYCDPKQLACVVTIGQDAKKYLAPAAKKQGCKVTSFMSPYDAGEWVKGELQKDAVVLAKGSQNGVFAEEALKPLLKDKKDEVKLVRQSKYWLDIKRQQFNG